jgi:hypothetical protein
MPRMSVVEAVAAAIANSGERTPVITSTELRETEKELARLSDERGGCSSTKRIS